MSSTQFDFQLYIVHAKAISQEPRDEAALRSAVSRAYYAAYWKARRHLEKQYFEAVPKEDAHAFVWEKFQTIKDKNGTPLCAIGKALRARRNWADYEATPNLGSRDAEAQILEAEELIAEVASLRK